MAAPDELRDRIRAKAKAAGKPVTTTPKGGAREGSGRKPKLLTELLLSMPGAAADVKAAYHLFRDIMRDEARPIELRMDAAREVLNRLVGKPHQAIDLSSENGGPLRIVIEYVDDHPDFDVDPAPPAPGAADDPGIMPPV